MRTCGIEHINICVFDLDRTIEFYSKILGFRLRSRYLYQLGNEFETAVFAERLKKELPTGSVKVDVAVMELNMAIIEFQQWILPKTSSYHGDPSVAGSPHIAVKVQNLDRARESLRAAGVLVSSEEVDVLESGYRPWRTCYLWDPDHILIELVEELPQAVLLTGIGSRIRQRRRALGLTIKDVATSVGVSSAHLSLVERGDASPTVTNLVAVANLLGVLPEHFLQVGSQATLVAETTKGAAQSGLSSGGDGLAGNLVLLPSGGGRISSEGLVESQRLSPPSETIELTRYRIDVGAGISASAAGRRGREIVSVLEGSIELLLDGVSQLLQSGESIAYDLPIARRFLNVGSHPALFIQTSAAG